jgi:hypothetical protein
MRTLIAVLFLALPVLADEVVCKDGRKIEFHSVEDTGETYTIVTPEGGRIVVKRAEVEGFAKTEPAVVLTGAAVSFDKKSKLDVVDLLKKVSLDRDALDGSWKFVGGTLVGSAGPEGAARLQIVAPTGADEYNLSLTIERTEGDDNVGIGFLTPAGQAMVHLDTDRGAYTGLLSPEGTGHRKVASAPGKQLTPGKVRTVVLLVRRSGLVVQVDGRDILTAKVDWSRVAILPQCAPNQKDAFTLFALKSGIRISRATVSTVSAGGK